MPFSPNLLMGQRSQFGVRPAGAALPAIMPVVDFQFARDRRLDPRITFTRASSESWIDRGATMRLAGNNEPAFPFDPLTGVSLGLQVFQAATNELVGSTLDGANLATQNVTVTAAQRTFSFYGSGTVVLSGAHSATIVGLGEWPVRTTLTFTPGAGTLTVTPSGNVKFAQQELGAIATPWHPTAGVSATRAASVSVMTGTAFSDWFNATEGTFVAAFKRAGAAANAYVFDVSNNTSAKQIAGFSFNGFDPTVVNTTTQASISAGGTVTSGLVGAFSYKANDFAAAANGVLATPATSGTVPSGLDRMYIGSRYDGGGAYLNGWLGRLTYYNVALSDSIHRGLSS